MFDILKNTWSKSPPKQGTSKFRFTLMIIHNVTGTSVTLNQNQEANTSQNCERIRLKFISKLINFKSRGTKIKHSGIYSSANFDVLVAVTVKLECDAVQSSRHFLLFRKNYGLQVNDQLDAQLRCIIRLLL